MSSVAELDQMAAYVREMATDNPMALLITPIAHDLAIELREQLGRVKPADMGAVLMLTSSMTAGLAVASGLDSGQNVLVINMLAIAGERLYTGGAA